jgi:hypothetical protein
MRDVVIIILCVACSSTPTSGTGSDSSDNGDSSSTPLFGLRGTVSNPLSSAQAGRLVVGVGRSADIADVVDCSVFIVKDEAAAATLPATYELAGTVPAGELSLIALLIDDPTSARVLIAPYAISVDAKGVHYNSPASITTLDIAMQGTTAYACP